MMEQLMRRYGFALACLMFTTPALAGEHRPSQARTARAQLPQIATPFLATATSAVQPQARAVQSRHTRRQRARVAARQRLAPLAASDDRYMAVHFAAVSPAVQPASVQPAFVQPTFAQPAFAPARPAAFAPAKTGAPPAVYASLVARHAAANGIPESLVHRVIMRESRYNPRAVSKGNYGMMQIRLGTARAMGYRGSAAGLLDPHTNMTYAVRYLAGAYRVAGGNPNRAVALYARGYYYDAKRQGLSLQQAAAVPSTPRGLTLTQASTDGFSGATTAEPRRRARR